MPSPKKTYIETVDSDPLPTLDEAINHFIEDGDISWGDIPMVKRKCILARSMISMMTSIEIMERIKYCLTGDIKYRRDDPCCWARPKLKKNRDEFPDDGVSADDHHREFMNELESL